MTIEHVAKLEMQFGLTFPSEYRQLLLEYPFPNDKQELTNDSDVLIQENLACRANDPWEFPWSAHFWWVGEDGSGGFYFVNCREVASTVYYFDHEVPATDFGDREKLKPTSLAEFVSSLASVALDFENERQRRLKQIAERRWWQFWIPRRSPRGSRATSVLDEQMCIQLCHMTIRRSPQP